MSAANQLLGDRYQFIQILSANDTSKTLLVADVHYPEHPKCVIRQIQLSTRNPITLKFVVKLLQKKVKVLEIIGRHRQIPSTFASFEIDHNFCIVQEFIPGRSLESELIPTQPMPESAVLALLTESLTALAFAQDHGVVHGRLKPVKIIRHRTDNRLVLLDFGSIKHISQEISKDSPQLFERSPADRIYVAPEQRQGQARFCTDHYALGMIAIQALTGLPPEEFPDTSHSEVHQEITALLQNTPGLGINTASLLARMVHPNPDRRFRITRLYQSLSIPQLLSGQNSLRQTQP
ncbi:MAG: protein kinase [Cyanobacteria bacterium J06636_16]